MFSSSHFRSLGGSRHSRCRRLRRDCLGRLVSQWRFSTSQVEFRDVTEAGDTVPPGLFAPPSPTPL